MKVYNKLRLILFFSLVIMLFVQADSEEPSLQTIDEILSNKNASNVEQPVLQQEIDDSLTGDVVLEEQPLPYTNISDEQETEETPIEIEPPKDVSLNNSAIDQPGVNGDIPLIEDKPQNQIDLPLDEQPPDDLFNGLLPNLPGPKPEGGSLDNPPGLEQGENWERTCTATECTHTIYPYQKYYREGEQWNTIDESFYSTPCQQGYDFCVIDNLYQLYMKAYPDTTHPILFSYQGMDLRFKPQEATFTANQQRQTVSTIRHSPSQVTSNRAQYPSAFGNALDIEFKYLPRMFKEELVLRDRNMLLTNLTAPQRDIMFEVQTLFDIDASTQIYIDGNLWDQRTRQTTQQAIEFRQGTTSLYLAPPLAYDARGVTLPLTYVLENTINGLSLTIQTPYDWLMNATRTYPIVIDPTITLDYTSITWDGYLVFDSAGDAEYPGRNGVTTDLPVGDLDNAPNPGFTNHRADIDWNIASIPDTADIINVDFTLYLQQVNTNNDEFRFYHMVGGNAHHPNTDPGNVAFYDDLTDGTNYLNATVSSGSNSINLTASINLKNDLEILLVNGTDEWSLGMRSEETGASGAAESRFTSSEGTLANRPSLTIIYEPWANEAEGDIAIQQGIMNAFNNVSGSVEDNQQIYVYNSTGGHQMGSVDALAINGSKRWIINYVSSGEPFLDLGNMSTIAHSLELSDLTSLDIIQRVEDFIRGTL